MNDDFRELSRKLLFSSDFTGGVKNVNTEMIFELWDVKLTEYNLVFRFYSFFLNVFWVNKRRDITIERWAP